MKASKNPKSFKNNLLKENFWIFTGDFKYEKKYLQNDFLSGRISGTLPEERNETDCSSNKSSDSEE